MTTSPFAAAIDILRATMEWDWMMNDDYYVIPRVKSLEAAIRVLEAAGELEKRLLLPHFLEETSHIKCYYCTQIRALLSALPDHDQAKEKL